MPADPGRALSDGRLNLEQQKKRAKELTKAARAGESAAIARLHAQHPRGGGVSDIQLADAQAAVAREAGFASWAKLKAHTERLGAARAAMRRRDETPDSARTLHIRCGSDLKGALKRAGFVGGFLEFADPYCMGPVRDLPPAAFIEARAGFVAEAFGMYPGVVRERLEREYAALADVSGRDAVILWFEHDSYDQLILAKLLADLSQTAPTFLICVDHTPGVARFVGLGQLAPEVIRLFWEKRVRVGPEHRALGCAVWSALTAPSPEGLHQLASEGTAAVPPMAGALARHLRELPSTANGLSLTEQLTLDWLAEHGPTQARALFVQAQAREPLPFLGDAMFWAVLRALAAGPRPLIVAGSGAAHHEASWAERTIALTADGEAVQAGRADRLTLGCPVRWLGGVALDPDRPCWRWDETAARPLLTSVSKA